MNQRQFASVLLAVFGILMAVSQLPQLSVLISEVATWSASQDQTNPFPERMILVAALCGTLLALLIGAGLALSHERLAQRLFPDATHPLLLPEAQAVAFSVLGCYFVVEGLSGIARDSVVRRLSWVGVVQVALGLALFLGAHGLARLWSQLRAAAAYAPPGDAPSN